MAVNDLMMKIQLLVDSGKSSAELGRVSKALTDLTRQLDKVQKTQLALKDQIGQLNDLKTALLGVDAKNFVQSLGGVNTAFKKLSLDPKNIDALRTAFADLGTKKAALEAKDYAGQLKSVAEQIKEASRYKLTSALETPTTAVVRMTALKIQAKQYTNQIKDTVSALRLERQAVMDLNQQIQNSANLYAIKRTNDDPTAKSLEALKNQLTSSERQLSQWNRALVNEKTLLGLTKDALKEVRSESSQLGKSKLIDFGLQSSDIANVQKLLGSIGKSIDVGAIQKARDEIFSLKDQIKEQQQLVKDTKSLVPLATGDLEKTKALLRGDTIELAKQNKAIAEQKELRAKTLLLTDSEYQKVKSLRTANDDLKSSIDFFSTGAKNAKRFIGELNQEIRNIKFDAGQAKGLLLPDQAGQLSQLNDIRNQLKSIDLSQLKNLREQIRLVQQGGRDGTFTLVNEGQRDSIRKVTQDVRDLRQQLRVEGQPNLINFKDSSGQVRNLISDVTTLKNNILQLKQFSAGEGTIKLFQDDSAQKQKLNEQIASQKKLNEQYGFTSSSLVTIKEAYNQYNEAAKKGDTAARANIDSAIASYNKLNKLLGENKGEGLQFGLKTDTAVKRIGDLETKILSLSVSGTDAFKKLNNDLTNIKPLEINQSVTLSGLNQIQKAIRDIKAEQQAFKLEKIVPLDAKTNVYDKTIKVLRLFAEEVGNLKAAQKEMDQHRNTDAEKFDKARKSAERYSRRIEEIKSALQDAGVSTQKFYKAHEVTGALKLSSELIAAQADALYRKSTIEKLNSALLSQQNVKRSEELANLVRQEVIGKNNIANIKQQLEQVNQLVTAERARAKTASEDIKSNQLNTKLAELNALKSINEELKAVLKTEQQRRQGLRETAKLLLDQGKSRALDFTAQIPGLQSLVNLNRDAKAQAEGTVKALKDAVQSRKDEITQLEQQKKLNAEVYQRKIDQLTVNRAATESIKAANDAEKQRLLLARDQQQGKIDLDTAAAKAKLGELESLLTSSTAKFNELRKAAQQSAKEAENLAKSDVAGRQQSIQAMDQVIAKIKERVKADEQSIKAYAQGIKEYEKGLKAEIAAANQRIASGQLNKAQYEEERKNINNLIKERQQYSKDYVQTLRDAQATKQLELKTERDAIKLLDQQATALQGVAKAQLDAEVAQRKRSLAQQGGTESQVKRQIQETESLTRAELSRLAALEKIAQQTNSLSGIFRRLNGSASVEPAIQATQRLITNVTEQLKELGNKSLDAKQKLSNLGATSDLSTVSSQIKQTVADLKSLKNAGFTGTQTYADLEKQLSGLREQRALLRQIASVDTKTQAGQLELKGLNENLKGLKAYASEMGRVQRFMQGFGFNLTAEMLGQSAFQTVTNLLQRMGQAFIEANSKAETLIRGLDAVFGAGQGDVQYEKLTELANTYGLGLQDLSRNYLQLNASAKGTTLQGAESEKIFRSLSAAMAVLGADTISTQRAFRAVSQMISKGQVYAEELKGQLAESLPGAVQLFARSMGKTTQEFLAMVKAGQVGLNELIPFFKLIEQEYGNAATASTTYEQATNRLGNAWILLLKGIGDLGVWKAVVAAIDETSGAVQFLADRLKNNPFEELYNLQNLKVEIVSEEQFNKLREIQGKKVTSTGLFDANDYAAYKKANEEVNKQLDERIKKLKESKIEFDIQETRNSISSITNELKDVLTREQYEVKIKASIPDITSSEIDSAYEKYLKQFDKKIVELTKLREQLNKLLSSQSTSDEVDTQRLVRTKQQIAATKNYLNLQQQAYSALSTIQSTIDQREGKASGLADSLINEYKATQVLARAYEELARAKVIEGSIKRNQENPKDDTTPEQIKEVRQLTIDQLKQAMTVARTANNYSLIVSLLSEISRVQNDINMDEMTQSTRDTTSASKTLLDQQEGFKKNLRDSATAGFGFARSIYQSLTATEQLNRLISTQRVLNAQNAQDIINSARAYKDAKKQAEDNEKSVRKSQQDEGIYFTDAKKNQDYAYMAAREAFAQSEEQIAQAKKSTDAEEKTRLMELAQANLEVARARAIEAGKPFLLKQIEDELTALREQKKAVNALSYAKQEAKLIELGAATPEELKAQFAGLDEKIKAALQSYKDNVAAAAKAEAAGQTGDKNTYLNRAEAFGKLVNQLKDEQAKLVELFNKQGTLGEVKFNTVIDPAALEELNKLRNSMMDVVKQPLPQAVEVGKTAVSDAQQKRSELESIFSAPIVQTVSISTESTTAPLPSIGELFGSTEQQLQSLGGFFRNVSIEGAAAGQVINTVGQQTKLTLNQLQKMNQLPPGQYTLEMSDQQGQPIEPTLKRVQQLLGENFTVKVDYVTATLPDGLKTQQSTLVITPKVDATAVTSEGTKAGQAVATTAQTAVNASPITIQAVSLSSLAPQIARDGIQLGRDLSANLRDGLEQQGVNVKIETVVDQTSIEGWKRQVQRLSADDGRISLRPDTAELDQAFRRIDGQFAEWSRVSGSGLNGSTFVVASSRQVQDFSLLVDQVNQKMRAINNPKSLPEFKPVIEPVVPPKSVYQQVQEQLNTSNPITVSANAAPMVGNIQQELDDLRKSGATNIKVDLDETSGQLVVTADTSQATASVDAIISRIESSRTVLRVRIVYDDPGSPVSGSSTSTSSPVKRRYGGPIPGYGGGDRVSALLERGEFVMRKEAVKAIGLQTLLDANRLGKLAIPKVGLRDSISVPRFANGGPVQGQPIVINIPGGKTIQVSGSRDSAMQLANLLTRVGRAV